jgi:hypothetical protein
MVIAVGVLTFSLLNCSSSQTADKPKAARSDEVDKEVSLKADQDAISELRKDIPEEIRRSNDKLAETLNRWKVLKTEPNLLREHFDDEIRKLRSEMDKRQRRKRDDFQRAIADQRKEFQEKQKEKRDDFLSSKPKSEKRQEFMNRQSEDRDTFNSDLRDKRDEFEDVLKDERKQFEGDISNRWVEFRQEYPEYQRRYKEMKEDEARRREEEVNNPKPYSGWPYKTSGDGSDSGAGVAKKPDPASQDVNKGQDGWPASDSSEFEKMGK